MSIILRPPVVGSFQGNAHHCPPEVMDHRIGGGFAQLRAPDGLNRIGRHHWPPGRVARAL
jgi:hypothetical protein